jgi:hypothetical protein
MLLRIFTCFLLVGYAHYSLCACSHSKAMKGSSSFRFLILSRLLASPVWAQLTLADPNWVPRPLLLQNGGPSHRVRAHSLTRVQNKYYVLHQKTITMKKLTDFPNLVVFIPIFFGRSIIFQCSRIITDSRLKPPYF